MLAKLERLIGEIGDLNSKLILLVGPSRSGKTQLLRQLSAKLNIEPLNVGLELGRRLAATPNNKRGFSAGELLRDTGVYAIYIGFNSSEVRTESIFNPFAYEVHDAEDLVKPGYAARHFVAVPYDEKVRAIAWVRAMIQAGPLRHYLPAHWLQLMDAESAGWQPLAAGRIDEIVHGFNVLRGIEGYYLRNAAISLSEGIVRASYNCDGTYIVRADYFAEFVRVNTP